MVQGEKSLLQLPTPMKSGAERGDSSWGSLCVQPASQGGACILTFNCVDWTEWVTERVSNEKPLHPQDQRLMLLSGVHAISLPLKFHGSDLGKEALVLEKILLLDSWQSSVIPDDGSRWVLSSASSSLKRQV